MIFKRKARLPVLTTAAEYQKEAREDRPVIRFMGLNDSAIMPMGQHVVERRYKRHCEFFAAGDWVKVALLWLIWLVISVGVFVFFFLYEAGQMETRSLQGDPLINAAVAVVAATFGFIAFAKAKRLLDKWHAAYAKVYVFETADLVDDWRTTGVLTTFLPRLAFIDNREGDYFSGPSRQSGPNTGLVHLALPHGKKIVDMQGVMDCYGLPASKSSFTEVPARETYDLLQRTVEAGQLRRGLGKNKAMKFVTENWAWILSAINGMIILFLSGAGQTSTGG